MRKWLTNFRNEYRTKSRNKSYGFFQDITKVENWLAVNRYTSNKDIDMLYVLWSIFAALVGTIRSGVLHSTAMLTFETNSRLEEIQFLELAGGIGPYGKIPSLFFLLFGIPATLKLLLTFVKTTRAILKLRTIYNNYKEEKLEENDKKAPTTTENASEPKLAVGGGPGNPKRPPSHETLVNLNRVVLFFFKSGLIVCCAFLLWVLDGFVQSHITDGTQRSTLFNPPPKQSAIDLSDRFIILQFLAFDCFSGKFWEDAIRLIERKPLFKGGPGENIMTQEEFDQREQKIAEAVKVFRKFANPDGTVRVPTEMSDGEIAKEISKLWQLLGNEGAPIPPPSSENDESLRIFANVLWEIFVRPLEQSLM